MNRLAAKELRSRNLSPELAAELEEIADEIEESSARFASIADTMEAIERTEASLADKDENY